MLTVFLAMQRVISETDPEIADNPDKVKVSSFKVDMLFWNSTFSVSQHLNNRHLCSVLDKFIMNC